MKLIGRKKETRRIVNFATSDPENKAFFGVKGVGKSSLFETVFSKANCKSYAEEYRYLFVRTILSPNIKGTELTNFLIDRVINGIDLIEDESIRDNLHEQLRTSAEKYNNRDSLLRDILETIKDYEYSFILIMDDFHNMGRNSDVGSEQYDFLRSLTELGLVYYWIVSDSDFSDVYATAQFTTSFFAQKFIAETIPQMSEADGLEMIRLTADKYDVELSDEETKDIYSAIGGIPGFVVPAIKCLEEHDGESFDIGWLIQRLLEEPKCISLLTSWSRSLTEEQKDLIQEVAERHTIPEIELRERGDIGKINQLGNKSGLGLLVKKTGTNGAVWSANSLLFERYVLDRTGDFYAAAIKEPVVPAEPVQPPVVQYITNNIMVNNVFSPDNAVKALAGLKQFLSSGSPVIAPPERLLSETVQQLPFYQDEWAAMDDEQKDAKLDEYAESVFESEDFQFDSLSESQMTRFFLTSEILEHLSEANRRNLISAIQVYDLLQFCIDRFGLDFQHSESARGILFAKVYESILKDNLRKALTSVSEIASMELRVGKESIPLADCDEEQLTIGSFQFVISRYNVKQVLGDVCTHEIGRADCGFVWWKDHASKVWSIQDLRNDCCHAGDKFDSVKLQELLKYLFEESAIADIMLYDAIAQRSTT